MQNKQDLPLKGRFFCRGAISSENVYIRCYPAAKTEDKHSEEQEDRDGW